MCIGNRANAATSSGATHKKALFMSAFVNDVSIAYQLAQ